MSEARDPAARDHPVFAPFRRKEKDPKTGISKSVTYDPDGEAGWPGSKGVFVGVPGSDEVLELQAGVLLDVDEGTRGRPLIGEAIEAETEPEDEVADKGAEKKPVTRRTSHQGELISHGLRP